MTGPKQYKCRTEAQYDAYNARWKVLGEVIANIRQGYCTAVKNADTAGGPLTHNDLRLLDGVNDAISALSERRDLLERAMREWALAKEKERAGE